MGCCAFLAVRGVSYVDFAVSRKVAVLEPMTLREGFRSTGLSLGRTGFCNQGVVVVWLQGLNSEEGRRT